MHYFKHIEREMIREEMKMKTRKNSTRIRD